MGEETGARHRLRSRMVSLWPVTPFLGFGFCAAWFSLATGTAWISPGATSGEALTNMQWVLNVVMSAALALVYALSLSGGGRLEAWVGSAAVAVAAGSCASAGSLLLILIGPGFLQTTLGSASHALFQAACVLTGLGFGILCLRLGMLYSLLPLRRAIVYLCYAHLLAVFVYLCVQVSPPLPISEQTPPTPLIVAFAALPLLAAWTLCLDPTGNPWLGAERTGDGQVTGSGGESSPAGQDQHLSRRSSACFAVVLLLFSLVQAGVTTNVTNSALPMDTLGGSDLGMLLRVPVLLAFALLASTLEASRFNFSKLCMGLVVLLELLIALALAMDDTGGAWVVAVKTITFAFELLVWCLLFAVAGCRRRKRMRVVALFFGVYTLGTGLGTLAGASLPDLMGASAFYLTCVIALLPTFLLLGERNIDGLFWGGQKSGTSLESLLGKQLRGSAPERMRGEFRRRLDEYAASKGLSAREAETLRFLVAGRGDSQIADAMGISYNTARTHVRNVYAKLGVHDRQALIDAVNELLR